jgi:hypothetical protein
MRSSVVADRLAIPLLASATVGAAFLSTAGVIPHIPVVSEMIGLAAVFMAPGLATEPALRGRGWITSERFGLAATLSLAFCALAGVLLHIVEIPVTSANLLLALLGASALLGGASVRHRLGGRSQSRTTLPTDAIVGICCLALLGGAFATILVARPAPAEPQLEIVLVDRAGRLLVQPVHLAALRGDEIDLAFRSPSGTSGSVDVAVTGDGLQSTTREVRPSTEWTTIGLPVLARRTGTILGLIHVSGDGVDLQIPIQFEAT